MYRPFGLARDPFAPVWDGPLYWETPERSLAREKAMGALCAGRGVWLRGSEGAGRGTFLCRLAEDAALDGACVLLSDRPAPETGEDLLARLLELSVHRFMNWY